MQGSLWCGRTLHRTVPKVTVGINHRCNLYHDEVAPLAPPIRLIYGRVGGGRSLNWNQSGEGTSWWSFCHHTQRSAPNRKGLRDWEFSRSSLRRLFHIQNVRGHLSNTERQWEGSRLYVKKFRWTAYKHASVSDGYLEKDPSRIWICCFFFLFLLLARLTIGRHWTQPMCHLLLPKLLTRNMQIIAVYG